MRASCRCLLLAAMLATEKAEVERHSSCASYKRQRISMKTTTTFGQTIHERLLDTGCDPEQDGDENWGDGAGKALAAAKRSEWPRLSAKIRGSTVKHTVGSIPQSEPSSPLLQVESGDSIEQPSWTSERCMTALHKLSQQASAAFRKNWPMLLFYASLVALTCVVYQYIKSSYTAPQILTARFFAATTVVCFVVFLFPFVRGFQGQVYNKLAVLGGFFNPELHKLLGPIFFIAGTAHGMIWIISTLKSCPDTWCALDVVARNVTAQSLCVEIFCGDEYDGGFPSFSSSWGEADQLPPNLIKRQSAVRSFYIGFLCWAVFAVICALALPYFRRKHFEWFYYSHHLFVIAIPIFFDHCWTMFPSFFFFESQMMVYPCGVAVIIYICDKMTNLFLRRQVSHTVDFINYTRGNILELRLRPEPAWPMLSSIASRYFRRSQRNQRETMYFAPGAYIDINCPAISAFQWHPFTISSNPDADFVSVTIKVVPGGWTEQLQKACIGLLNTSVMAGTVGADGAAVEGLNAANQPQTTYGLGIPLKINASGPFGAPSIAYQNYDYLIGVGGGIGFTPFMSILKDFLNKKHEDWHAEDSATRQGGVSSRDNVALFYGICRSFDDVAWWSSLTCEPNFSALVQSCSVLINDGKRRVISPTLSARASLSASGQFPKPQDKTVELSGAHSPAKGRLAVTLFCTGASAGKVEQARALAPDGVTVRPGRPQFDTIFKDVDRQLQNARIGVFVCGGDSLCDSVEAAALAASVGSSNEFVFHKEIFG